MIDTVYIETSIVSLATARPSTDIVMAAMQQQAREWWFEHGSRFELVTSQHVAARFRRGGRGRPGCGGRATRAAAAAADRAHRRGRAGPRRRDHGQRHHAGQGRRGCRACCRSSRSGRTVSAYLQLHAHRQRPRDTPHLPAAGVPWVWAVADLHADAVSGR